MTRPRILLLGGTGEGFALADTLASRGDLDVVTSMAGATEMPRLPKGQLRRGGFGGVDGLVSYLREEKITAMIDATHPFAARMSANADAAAAATGVPLVHVWRQPWVAGDRWTEVASIEAAAAAIPAGARVFLTTGRSELSAFAVRDDVWFLARIVQPVERRADEIWPPQLTFLYDRGPFDEAREAALLEQHRIDVIVSKNSGGAAAYAKLAAARRLGIPVIIVQRPARPQGRCVDNAAEAVAWLDETLSVQEPDQLPQSSFQRGLESKPASPPGSLTAWMPAFAGMTWWTRVLLGDGTRNPAVVAGEQT